MKYQRLCLWIFVPAVVIASAACKQELGQGPQVTEEPQVTWESGVDAEPLLLLEDTEELAPPIGPVADNSRCHVCHINYADEELAVVHARANVGCERCHGSCNAHCNDENNVTPPDIMYPVAKINPSCMVCHPRNRIDTQAHEPLFAGIDREKKYCTNCHGRQHRIRVRTVRWNKATGELIKTE